VRALVHLASHQTLHAATSSRNYQAAHLASHSASPAVLQLFAPTPFSRCTHTSAVLSAVSPLFSSLRSFPPVFRATPFIRQARGPQSQSQLTTMARSTANQSVASTIHDAKKLVSRTSCLQTNTTTGDLHIPPPSN